MVPSASGATLTFGVPKPPIKPVQNKRPPHFRRLRVYALDPSMAKTLDTISVNQTILTLPWEPDTEPLRPGPVNEYLEVVDVDPASNKVYDPVDLNDKVLLAQDGCPPSEGNPQFHQQMVYAVAMATIGRFEKALGRKALWAPHSIKDETGEGWPKHYEVPRLRIYPHALRTDNAYYSPEKKALLFGYFPAAADTAGATAPGSMVFSCLSSDIIAHEMSHALLDGLHRRFEEASNPDVPAFHEAFADVVALFQHFSIKELVSFEIARARGKLSAAKLLAGLAQQFGEGISRPGPLRDYLSPEISKLSYTTTEDVHDRGSILVLAVYEAFLKIVDTRTEDLVRIATSGTGVLPRGALHPDLVHRLTEETCSAAEDVLERCIRALDYCPAVDITFGEYLRALITADLDLVSDDRDRVAFMEAFRRRGILPKDVRTVSEEALQWQTLENPKPPWLKDILNALDFDACRVLSRSAIFRLRQRNCRRLWEALNKVLKADPDVCRQFGLVRNLPKYNEKFEELKDALPGGTAFDVVDVRLALRAAPDGLHPDVIATIQQRRPIPNDPNDASQGSFWFRGGATLILDSRKEHEAVRYVIVKHTDSKTREETQQKTAMRGFLSPLRALYFGEANREPFAMMHAAEDFKNEKDKLYDQAFSSGAGNSW